MLVFVFVVFDESFSSMLAQREAEIKSLYKIIPNWIEKKT